jgi:hypothetical protein
MISMPSLEDKVSMTLPTNGNTKLDVGYLSPSACFTISAAGASDATISPIMSQ